MSQSKTTALNFTAILKKAKSGDYKLPAFQRKWKWTNQQVMALYDSLRLGYPIGAFLFLTSDDAKQLAPRAFHGSGNKAASKLEHESLILDGQQRITAGLSIVYGLDDVDGSEYYIDVNKISALITEHKVNIEAPSEVEQFCHNLEIDDGYIVAKKKRKDRSEHFDKSRLLWTPYLTEDKFDELDAILDEISDKREKLIIRKVIRAHLKPNTNIQVPVIELGNDFDLSSIARIFTTINTTGKQLTSFELVVAILYPNGIKLEDDISDFKSKHPHYKNLDKNGEILLQVIALLDGKSPKKSDLPKNINHTSYSSYGEKSAALLESLGKFLTKSLGLGLDSTSKNIPYDAIFAPMSLALYHIESTIDGLAEKAAAERKLKTWFVASALMQRYQEGVHNKQTRDLEDIKNWIDKGEASKPTWIKESYISRAVIGSTPNGAIGKLFICLLNRNTPVDPLKNEQIGYGELIHQTDVHHIYPSRWAPKGLTGYDKADTHLNLALNTMLLYSKTNGDWLNFAPETQVKQARAALGTDKRLEEVYQDQFVSKEALEILERPKPTKSDYEAFINSRYKSFVSAVEEFGIYESTSQEEGEVELESPSISDE